MKRKSIDVYLWSEVKDHRCQLTTTTYYLLQFDLIWWEKKNFGRKFEKNDDWKKNKLFAWSDGLKTKTTLMTKID